MVPRIGSTAPVGIAHLLELPALFFVRPAPGLSDGLGLQAQLLTQGFAPFNTVRIFNVGLSRNRC
tara:strand:+ start:106 stop:300 length:195 start_codon:yes stop_codon:yes gene_type:complete